MRREAIFTLRRAGACERDQFRKIAVALAILREQDQPERGGAVGVAQLEVRTDHERQARFLCRDMRTHDACERTFVGDGES